jgi:DNA-binding response OmpR family regulator
MLVVYSTFTYESKYRDFFPDLSDLQEKPKLLVLDDHESMYELYRYALREEFDVTWSPRKEPFLEAISVHPELAPDLAITDYNSGGMNGLELLKGQREYGLDDLFPVIVMTGYGGYRKEMLDLGAADFVAKPCSLKHLRSTIRRVYFFKRGIFLPLGEDFERPVARNRPRLMILDDLRCVIYTYLMILYRNYDITWSLRKDRFLEQITRDPGSAPEIVISDISSYPMNGYRFLEELWKRGLDDLFPVIVISAVGTWGRAIEWGADEFMAKPFEIKRLKNALARAVRRGR